MTPLFWICVYAIFGIAITEIGMSGAKERGDPISPFTYPFCIIAWPLLCVLSVIVAWRKKS